MKISGIQKTSLMDYPDHLAAIIFTQGCNFACPYCHNPHLIPNSSSDNSYYSENKVLEFLKSRKGLIDGVVITGGEPTLQSDLLAFIEKIKVIGLKVKLDTNGSNPELLAQLINEDLLDYIAMDVKAPLEKEKAILGKTGFKESIVESIQLIKNSNIDYEFRTTVVPTLHDKEKMGEIGKLIQGSKCHYIQNFRPKNTLDPELSKVKEFPPSKLEKFKNILKKYVEHVTIRN
ncbi:anaerobic ribonucleoside-triphosphate reductase activating protein [Halanaerobacter jeridensis]|uniref:Pyruvate formate lyase activating enzyme n=1 Tax=Halanaerobacter jeridensis TaxID=706427 RepID=A0A939BPU5_9FIRM|nr:anaerobic ribonucleoside-triphosphate reductase activating protein [Halanaerobacter jeridensis]MBM7557303.1 pyruvate formate lyase activating enzyme [Halanaerobacter jeridensis]